MEIDPVCGMEVDPQSAAASWEHSGVTYYFCSQGCLEDFKEDPDAHLR
ncbi:MAG TPA: YHS domain-containing protein [Actinomycetota bacterium]|nr:YHS domain-containing protein [Actinomycetota bacterium]